MKTGIELIKAERQEQITKHGFSLELDKKYYQKKELKHAAEYCLMLAEYKQFKGNNIFWPEGWGKDFEHKIINKSVVGKLTVAGALLMAENERRGDNYHALLIEHIAAEIDKIQSLPTTEQKDKLPVQEEGENDFQFEMRKRKFEQIKNCDCERCKELLAEYNNPTPQEEGKECIERILCAAIWYKDLPTQGLLAKNQDKGLLVCGHRHGQCIDIMSTLGKLRSTKFGPNSVGETEQGFLTNTNRFVDRTEGMKIAVAAKQVINDKVNIDNPILFSEDLY